MVCIEILHNGKRVCVMGHEKAESLQASLFYHSQTAGSRLTTHAEVAQTTEYRESLSWLENSPPIQIGDTVELRLTEGLAPDPSRVIGSFGKHVSGEATELFCSFCGKSQHKVKRLIAGPRVFICNECVGLCNEIIGEEEKA